MYLLYLLPLLQQWRFVFDFISSRPCLDLVTKSLKLLDFPFEVVLQLVLLSSIGGGVNFLVDAVELLYAFGDLLEGLVDLLLCFPGSHGCSSSRGRGAKAVEKIGGVDRSENLEVFCALLSVPKKGDDCL